MLYGLGNMSLTWVKFAAFWGLMPASDPADGVDAPLDGIARGQCGESQSHLTARSIHVRRDSHRYRSGKTVEQNMRNHPREWIGSAVGLLGIGVALGLIFGRRT